MPSGCRAGPAGRIPRGGTGAAGAGGTSRDAHAQAQSALESRHAAHERRWLNELDAERSAAKRLQSKLDEAVAASQRKTAALEAELLRAGERQQTGEREAQARFAEQAARLTRLEAELAAHARRRNWRPGARGRGKRPGTLRSARATQTAELQARIREQDGQLAADPASDDADHAGAGRSGNGDRAGATEPERRASRELLRFV